MVAPAILVAVTHWPYRRAPGRLPEAVALGLVVARSPRPRASPRRPRSPSYPAAADRVALRFWQPGAVAATPDRRRDRDPAHRGRPRAVRRATRPTSGCCSPRSSSGVASLTGLVLAAVISERARAERDARRRSPGTLQESLLPAALPAIPGIETAVDFRAGRPRASIVGGDFYDVFPSDDGSWAVVVGDVLGKDARRPPPRRSPATRCARPPSRKASRAGSCELNDAIRRQSPDQLCTAVYSRVESQRSGRASIGPRVPVTRPLTPPRRRTGREHGRPAR